jgi:hypothetical protein
MMPIEEIVPGLKDPRARGLERIPIRTREASMTLSAWRLGVVSEEGSGAIVAVEAASGETLYRGEGIFLGWTQDRLIAAYRALLPAPEVSAPDSPQLG